MTTPTGLPAWARTTTIEDLGGHVDKRNLLDIGKVNARTDVDAGDIQRIAESVVSAARTAPLFWMTLRFENPDIFWVEQCSTQWAGLSGQYLIGSPTTVQFPTVTGTRTSLVVTFPGITVGSTVVASDVYGVSVPVEWHAHSLLTDSLSGGTVSAFDSTSITLTLPGDWTHVTLVVR